MKRATKGKKPTRERAKAPPPSDRPRAVRDPGEERRSELLDAAYTLIAEKGLEGLRTRDIVARAGVNISTLHYYFGTKDELLVAVLDHVRDKFVGVDAQGAAASGGQTTMRSHIE